MFWWLPCPDIQSHLELSFAGHFHLWFTVGAEWASQQNVWDGDTKKRKIKEWKNDNFVLG